MTTSPTILQSIPANSGNAAATGLTFTLPAAPTVNNLLVLLVGRTQSITTPTGWNNLTGTVNSAGQANTQAFWRTVQNGDPAALTIAFTSGTVGGMLYEVAGATFAAPTSNTVGGSSTAHPTGTFTPAVDNTLILMVGACASDTTGTPESGWTEDSDQSSGVTTHLTVETQWKAVGTAASQTFGVTWAAGSQAQAPIQRVIIAPYPDDIPRLQQAAVTANTGASTATSLTLTLASTPTPGTVMLAIIAVKATSNIVTTPAGWTLVRSTVNSTSPGTVINSYTRATAIGDTAAQTFAFTTAAAAGALVELTNTDTVSPINVSNGATQSSGVATNVVSTTTTVANTLIVYATASNIATTVTPVAPIEETDTAGSGTAAVTLETQIKHQLTAASVNSNGTFAATGGQLAAQLLAIAYAAFVAVPTGRSFGVIVG